MGVGGPERRGRWPTLSIRGRRGKRGVAPFLLFQPEQQGRYIGRAHPRQPRGHAQVNGPLPLQSLAGLAEWYKAHPDDARQVVAVGESKPRAADPTALAAWTMLTNQLMNLDEFLCK